MIQNHTNTQPVLLVTRLLCAGAAAVVLILASAQGAESLRLHPENPRYFLFRGQPTVIISSGEHYGAVLNLDFDFVKYLAALEKDKLNHSRLFTGGAYVEPSGAFGIARNTLAPAEGRQPHEPRTTSLTGNTSRIGPRPTDRSPRWASHSATAR